MKFSMKRAHFVPFFFFGFLLFNLSSAFSQNVQENAVLVEEVCNPVNRWGLLVFAVETQPEAEIAAFQKILTGIGFLEKQIIVLAPDQPDAKQKPTLENIRNQLKWIRDAESSGPLTGQTPVRKHSEEACEVFVYFQISGFMESSDRCYLCPLDGRNKPLMPDSSDGVDSSKLLDIREFASYFSKSAVERRLVVANIVSPQLTRGSSNVELDSINSKTVFRHDSRPMPETEVFAVSVSLAQMVVNDQINVQPGHVDSFVDILAKAFDGFADQQFQGNRDNVITVREVLDYTKYYANMASPGSVNGILTGHDYPIAVLHKQSAPTASTGTKTSEMLSLVGHELVQPAILDRIEARESFDRAVANARHNPVSKGDTNERASELQKALAQRAGFFIKEKQYDKAFADVRESGLRWEISTTAGSTTLSAAEGRTIRLNANTRLSVVGIGENLFLVETNTGDRLVRGTLPFSTPALFRLLP